MGWGFKQTQTFNYTTKIKIKFIWTSLELEAFGYNKHKVIRNVLLAYPKSNNILVIHTGARKCYIGVVIGQETKPVKLYILNLTETYTC